LLEWPEESDPVIVRDLAFSPDGKLIASANDDGHVRVWDASVQRLVRDFAVTREAGAEKVLSVIFSPNGQLLASASEDGQIRLWRVSDWTPVRTLAGHTKEVWQVVFSPNGRYLLSASDDRSVRVWDVGTGRQIGLPVPHEGPVWSLDVSPDGKTLLTGSSDSTAHLWNIATAAGTIGVTHRAVLRVSEEPVWKVAFARKAGAPLLAAIAGADSEIHVLNLDHFDSFLEEPRKLEQQAMEQTGLQIADGPELSIVPEDRAAASPK
jgi:WD40 repeat protein